MYSQHTVHRKSMKTPELEMGSGSSAAMPPSNSGADHARSRDRRNGSFRGARYVIVSPARDEAKHIERTMESVVGQTVPPSEWIIVDDGSSDGTREMIERYAACTGFITLVCNANRGYRAPGAGVVEAFQLGYAALEERAWEYLVKLDADVSFASDYFERCFAFFDADPRLGIAGGTVCKLDKGVVRVDAPGDPSFHVRGATKIYRRACWEQIAPLVMAPGWDTIDEVRANMQGWTTRTFPELTLIQHKATGAAAGSWRDSYKNGRANHVAGYHPLFMLAKCARRLASRPVLVHSAALLAGYCSGYLSRTPPMIDQETIRFIRRQQIRRLMLRSSIYD